jgi:hypothetical protein
MDAMVETSRWADSKNDNFASIRPSRTKRARRALARFLITFSVGVAATLAWQSYGDAAREMIAKSSPQFSWLAPQAAAAQTPPAVQTPPNMVASAAPSPDLQQLKAVSLGIAAMRQSVDQLQNQMTNEIAKLRAAQQEVLDKISAPRSGRPLHRRTNPCRRRRRRSPRCADGQTELPGAAAQSSRFPVVLDRIFRTCRTFSGLSGVSGTGRTGHTP